MIDQVRTPVDIDTVRPRDLGVDSKKFAGGFREAQREAMRRIQASDARVFLVQAPTGVGKSLLARALGSLLNMTTTYCATTKDLQSQFCRDFPDAVELRGRSNYATEHGAATMTCEDCDYHQSNGCSFCGIFGNADSAVYSCPYRQQKRMALASPFAVLNTAYFLTEANFVGGFSDPDCLLVIDEADQLEKLLLDTISVTVSERRLQELKMPVPTLTDRPENEEWAVWARAAQEGSCRIAAKLGAAAEEMAQTKSPEHQRTTREARAWSSLTTRLGWLADNLSEDPRSWVRVDAPRQGDISFSPIVVGEYARRLLWQHAGRFVLMSATIISPEQFARDVGLEDGEWEWIDLPSDFPPENRPVRYRPAGSMARRNRDETIPLAIEAMDEILDAHAADRVLIHTHTYSLAARVLEHSHHAFRMLTYRTAAEREEALGRFAEQPCPILVAPSMERGIDLKDDLCRCVIVLLVPKPYYGDARVRLRLAMPDGERWNRVHQIRELCQMTGRGVRHRDDHCESYILDAEFSRLANSAAARRNFPKWWKDALEI